LFDFAEIRFNGALANGAQNIEQLNRYYSAEFTEIWCIMGTWSRPRD